jgi:hypothetical protein
MATIPTNTTVKKVVITKNVRKVYYAFGYKWKEFPDVPPSLTLYDTLENALTAQSNFKGYGHEDINQYWIGIYEIELDI